MGAVRSTQYGRPTRCKNAPGPLPLRRPVKMDSVPTLTPEACLMPETSLDTRRLQDQVDRWQAGDQGAVDDLLRAAHRRVERIARTMLRNFPAVRGGADTADVVQGALLRLLQALRALRP